MAFVEVRNLRKIYRGGFALNDISLSMEQGEIFTLMGPSGSGKSSLLRNICGLDMPDSGNISVDGRDITTVPTARRNIGMIFQDLAIFPHMTVYDNIAYGLRTQRENHRRIEERVMELASLLKISDLLDRFPGGISGGQRQRVALARSVAPSPSMLLLDEPLSSLDMQLRGLVRSEIKSFSKKLGLSMIYVTHDHGEGLYMADRAGLIFDGTLVRTSDPEDLFNTPIDEESARFFGYNVINFEDSKVAFYPTEVEIVNENPDLSGVVESTGFEGEYFRTYVKLDNADPVQLKLFHDSIYSEMRPGDRVGIRLKKRITLESP